MLDGGVTVFLALKFAERYGPRGPTRCLPRFPWSGNIAARCCGAWGKAAGLGGGIRRHEWRKSGIGVGNVPTMCAARAGLYGGVMLHFEIDL